MIKALLFDSGGVLNYPKTGQWHIPPRTFEYIDKKEFDRLPSEQLRRAFGLGLNYLDDNHDIQTDSQELDCFFQFYTIIFNELKQLNADSNTIHNIATDTVFNNNKFVFFDDVYEYIPIFHKGYKLGIVSDTWPSLERVYRDAGLYDYFSTFVMSSVLNVCKPHELMYTTALDELEIAPEEAIFIDDSYDNCIGAEKLGIQSVLMIRDNRDWDNIQDIKYIKGLDELYTLLEVSTAD